LQLMVLLSAYGLGSQHTAFLEQVASISTSVALIGASWELYLVRRPYCSFFALRFFFFLRNFALRFWCGVHLKCHDSYKLTLFRKVVE
jgi:hypothetical protein